MARATDPVCGVTVDDERAAARATYEGQSYSFCSLGCRARWEVDPKKYAVPQVVRDIPSDVPRDGLGDGSTLANCLRDDSPA